MAGQGLENHSEVCSLKALLLAEAEVISPNWVAVRELKTEEGSTYKIHVQHAEFPDWRAYQKGH